MFFEATGPALEEALLNDQLLYEYSPAESFVNFELPCLDSDGDWQLSDLDLNNCDSFVNSASDLHKDDYNLTDEFSFFNFDTSVLDEILMDTLNSGISNDSSDSGARPSSNDKPLCALETHDYLPMEQNWSNKTKRAETKTDMKPPKPPSWGEPKFCSEVNAYRCPVQECGKLYAKASHVRAHLRRHSGEKPYHCTWGGCEWRFARSDELARPRRSHSGDKPYRCGECGKRFARSDHLAKHGRVHARRAAAAAAAARRAHTTAHRRSTRGIVIL